jgi:cbb3-type cytochrome oxidase subunit 3
MNPVIEAAREGVTQGWLMGAMTIFFFGTFIGWTLWAWWPGNKDELDAAAHLPLDDGPGGPSSRSRLGTGLGNGGLA